MIQWHYFFCHIDFIVRSSIFQMLIIYISKIVGSVAKGCPLLEYFDLHVEAGWQNPLHIEVLIALSSLRRLRSVFINMYVNSGTMTPTQKEDLRVSLYAIAEQGLLEVSIGLIMRSYTPIKTNISLSYKFGFFLRKLMKISKTYKIGPPSHSREGHIPPVAVL